MDVDTLLGRAMTAIGKGTVYASPGKMPSFSATSWPTQARNDCSGFIAWCLRFPSESRKVDHPLYRKVNGGWFETTGIHKDGLEQTGYFSQIDDPLPGALVVYPDYIGSDGKTHDGHIGIVVSASGKGLKGIKEVVHCSLGNFANSKDAVQVTSPKPWLASSKSIIVWFEGLDD